MPEKVYPEYTNECWREVQIPVAESRVNTVVAGFAILYAILCMANIVWTLYQMQVAHQELMTFYVAGLAFGFLFMLVLVATADKFRRRSVKLVLAADPQCADHSPEAITFVNVVVLFGTFLGLILSVSGFIMSEFLPSMMGIFWLALGLWGIGRRVSLHLSETRKANAGTEIQSGNRLALGFGVVIFTSCSLAVAVIAVDILANGAANIGKDLYSASPYVVGAIVGAGLIAIGRAKNRPVPDIDSRDGITE